VEEDIPTKKVKLREFFLKFMLYYNGFEETVFTLLDEKNLLGMLLKSLKQ